MEVEKQKVCKAAQGMRSLLRSSDDSSELSSQGGFFGWCGTLNNRNPIWQSIRCLNFDVPC